MDTSSTILAINTRTAIITGLDFRYNARGVSDVERHALAIKQVAEKRLVDRTHVESGRRKRRKAVSEHHGFQFSFLFSRVALETKSRASQIGMRHG